MAGEQIIESIDVVIDIALLAVAVRSAQHAAGQDSQVITSAAALTALSTLHAAGAEHGAAPESSLRAHGLLQLINPSWRAAMPDEVRHGVPLVVTVLLEGLLHLTGVRAC